MALSHTLVLSPIPSIKTISTKQPFSPMEEPMLKTQSEASSTAIIKKHSTLIPTPKEISLNTTKLTKLPSTMDDALSSMIKISGQGWRRS